MKTETKQITIDMPDTIIDVLEQMMEKSKKSLSQEISDLLVEYLGTPEEIRQLMNDLTALKHDCSDAQEFAKELEQEVARKIKFVFNAAAFCHKNSMSCAMGLAGLRFHCNICFFHLYLSLKRNIIIRRRKIACPVFLELRFEINVFRDNNNL